MDKQILELKGEIEEVAQTNNQLLELVKGLKISDCNACTTQHTKSIQRTTEEIRALKLQLMNLSAERGRTAWTDLKQEIADLEGRIENLEDSISALQDTYVETIPDANSSQACSRTSVPAAVSLITPSSFNSSETSTIREVSEHDARRTENKEPTDKSNTSDALSSKFEGYSNHDHGHDDTERGRVQKRDSTEHELSAMTGPPMLASDLQGDKQGQARALTKSEGDGDTSMTRPKVRETNVRTDKHNVEETPENPPQQAPKNAAVEVVRQPTKMYLPGGEAYWRAMAQKILDIERLKTPEDARVYTVFCLDISESMAEGEAWEQAKLFITDYLKELEDLRRDEGPRGYKDECVSLVTFGHETKLQSIHVTNYSNIRNILYSLKLGGPTSLNGGLFIALAAVMSPKDNRPVTPIGLPINPKIIVITDGHVTDIRLQNGPDTPDPEKDEKTKQALLNQMSEYTRRGIDIFCVPVGKADCEFLQLMTAVADGHIRAYCEGRRLARRYFLCTRAGFHHIGLPIGDFTFDHLSEEDKMDIDEILEGFGKSSADQYMESSSDSLPPIGSRVCRGPDWMWKNQDSDGPGTVIGHNNDGQQVWVEWDNNAQTNIYRYGIAGQYDLLVVDKPRELAPGQTMAVGCHVRPGKGNRDMRLKESDKGVVIKHLVATKKAEVRWQNGIRGQYSYEDGDRQEIELWKDNGTVMYEPTMTDAESAAGAARPKKNKNM